MIINAAGRRVDELTGEGREGCGFGPCLDSLERGGAGCKLCDVIAKLPQPARRGGLVDAAAVDTVGEKPQTNPERDGAPKLSGERARRHPMWNKRRRDGPHRSNI